ncbi:MAG TPA: carbamoyl phosphate synthase large subunit [Deltaproteobacteria bacterium]|nr:carbamoyl phosphate synthase large subunit [Deltaproteobacteria bacterium]HCP45284.1 carbamoyl phosphate synthase large subunit [Deltaproteobacteria bacterium]
MPCRTDIESILIIGSGPIVIGQACEFDYSGTQACKALRDDGFRVILINSNPATVMTDPELANRTYIEPITKEAVEKVILREKPDALLPTMGGQTALNVTIELAEAGVLEAHGVELIGANVEAIRKAEDRSLFKKAMDKIGLAMPRGGFAYSMEDAWSLVEETGFPSIIRPSFTMGGTGGGIAYNREEFRSIVEWGLSNSPVGEVLVEESIIGWKEYELEVMRDLKDNVVIVCSIENFDPMGVHTGDSITVAPAQTLSDVEYQQMRDSALAIIREIGVDSGGSNIQYGVNPRTGRLVVIEANPRVSRSSALASKATGFPIAHMAAKLAVGYRLDEIPNAITRKTPAAFEPTIDYVVTKIPRWAFEKFPGAETTLGTQMKSVGEVMAIGRTFRESLQKGLASLEQGRHGLGADGRDEIDVDGTLGPESRATLVRSIRRRLSRPQSDNIFFLRHALRLGMSMPELREYTGIDPWFLDQIAQLVERESELRLAGSLDALSSSTLLAAKRDGFTDIQIAHVMGQSEAAVRERRLAAGIAPVFKAVDTCAAEFEAETPYYYSTYERGESEVKAPEDGSNTVIILGGGPNRIGQGIEFDYCCVHGAMALREAGYSTVMVNLNPETVSTDYDMVDRLYFEPLTLESVLEIIRVERPRGVVVQFGGQTPLKLAIPLKEAGVTILGTSPEDIDRAEDRDAFLALANDVGARVPHGGTVLSIDAAVTLAEDLGYPVLVRPSYVLGGRGMAIVYDEKRLRHYMQDALDIDPERPVLLDKFLENADEFDVDVLADCEGNVVVGGVMQHIEQAGIHSGDSSCVLPAHSVSEELQDEMRAIVTGFARKLGVVGLMNTQFAVHQGQVYTLEVNPRASRTVPFVSKATGIALAKYAALLMVGKTLPELGLTEEPRPSMTSVKKVVLPFRKLAGSDPLLGPEMKSTGEVMGIAPTFGQAFAKATMAGGERVPSEGTVFLSVNDDDKLAIPPIAKELQRLGFQLIATAGTAKALQAADIACEAVYKVNEGRPNLVDYVKNHEVAVIVNTPLGRESRFDERAIRMAALQFNIPCITTLAAADALVQGIVALSDTDFSVKSVQEWHAETPG